MFNFLANQSICMVYTVQEVQKHYSKIGFHGRQKIYKTGKVKSAANPKMKTLIFTHPHVLFGISTLPHAIWNSHLQYVWFGFNICIHLWDKLVKMG